MTHYETTNERDERVSFSVKWFEQGELSEGSPRLWETLFLTGPCSNAHAVQAEPLRIQNLEELPEEEMVTLAHRLAQLL